MLISHLYVVIERRRAWYTLGSHTHVPQSFRQHTNKPLRLQETIQSRAVLLHAAVCLIDSKHSAMQADQKMRHLVTVTCSNRIMVRNCWTLHDSMSLAAAFTV